jgi:hypothetical protein
MGDRAESGKKGENLQPGKEEEEKWSESKKRNRHTHTHTHTHTGIQAESQLSHPTCINK